MGLYDHVKYFPVEIGSYDLSYQEQNCTGGDNLCLPRCYLIAVMCGRYTIFQITDSDEIEDRFGATPQRDLPPRYNAAPGQNLPVITNERRKTVDELRWGLVPFWADDPDIGNRLINARAETIDEKNSFREAYKKRRCLILADGFYEWKEIGNGKQPYRVVTEDDGLFAMAGLWEQWTPPEDKSQADLDAFAANHSRDEEGEGSTVLESFTIITTEPNDTVSEIHNRMPVVLEPTEEDHWLTGNSKDLKSLLDPYPADRMNAYPVSKQVNNPSNDSPEVITEAGVGV